jgi:hypothetical protein
MMILWKEFKEKIALIRKDVAKKLNSNAKHVTFITVKNVLNLIIIKLDVNM